MKQIAFFIILVLFLYSCSDTEQKLQMVDLAGTIEALDYTENGEKLIAGNTTIGIWEIGEVAEERRKASKIFGKDQEFGAIEYLYNIPGKDMIVTHSLNGHLILLWDTKTGEIVHNYYTRYSQFYQPAVSPTGKHVALLQKGTDENPNLMIMDTEELTLNRIDEIQALDMHLAFSANGDRIYYIQKPVTENSNPYFAYYSLSSEEFQQDFDLVADKDYSLLDFSRGEDKIVCSAAGDNNVLQIYDISEKSIATIIEPEGWGNIGPHTVKFSADGSYISVYNKGKLDIYNTSTAQKESILYKKNEKLDIAGVAFSPDDKSIAVGYTDPSELSNLWIWNSGLE